MLAGGASAVAQTVPGRFDASRAREQFVQPPVPLSQPRTTTIKLPAGAAPAEAARVRLTVRRFIIEGSTVFSAAELEQAGAEVVGKTVSLQDIYDVAAKISARYGERGFVLSRAIIPPQELNQAGATIRVQIVEGYVNRVIWPKETSRYRDLFTHYERAITSARPTNIAQIERYMLLANDLPGLSFRSTLKPSDDAVAAATLVVEMTEKPLAGSVRLDNRGTKARGPIQLGATAVVANVLGQQESVTLTLATATDTRELRYIAGEFRSVLNGEGLSAFFNPYFSVGRPGVPALRALGYRSEAVGFETGLSYPIIRSREANLVVSAMGFATNSRADVDAGRFSDDRLRGLRVRAVYDAVDHLGGTNLATLTFSQGLGGLGSSANGALLASRAAGRVDFTKLELALSRIQPLASGFSLFGAAEAQYAGTPLLPSEQCGYGGARIGRAFDSSALLGDTCWSALGELRYDMPVSVPHVSFAQLYAFADYGQAFTRKAAVGTPERQIGSSVGGGVRVTFTNQLTGSFELARQSLGPDNQGWRAFFTLGATY